MHELEISPSKRLGGLGKHQRDRLRDFLAGRTGSRRSQPDSRLVVLAGPTAVGKGTVAGYIREHHSDVHLSVSATTRAPRAGETHGVSYFFVDDAEFDRMIEAGELLEWATVHNAYRYGTPRGPVEAAIAAGHSVLLEIDLQGARAVRRAMPEASLVFLLPPTWDELVRRLIGRGTEDPAEQAPPARDGEGRIGRPGRVRLPRRQRRRGRCGPRGRRLDADSQDAHAVLAPVSPSACPLRRVRTASRVRSKLPARTAIEGV